MTWRMGMEVSSKHVGRGVARGCADKPGLRRIVCAFDEETFDAIRRRALRDKTSFAEQVRLLCEWSLEDS